MENCYNSVVFSGLAVVTNVAVLVSFDRVYPFDSAQDGVCGEFVCSRSYFVCREVHLVCGFRIKCGMTRIENEASMIDHFSVVSVLSVSGLFYNRIMVG
ncbi:MAG: hypothetical protein ACFFCW_18445 [Candidatus Hodarchaeota archaeon]